MDGVLHRATQSRLKSVSCIVQLSQAAILSFYLSDCWNQLSPRFAIWLRFELALQNFVHFTLGAPTWNIKDVKKNEKTAFLGKFNKILSPYHVGRPMAGWQFAMVCWHGVPCAMVCGCTGIWILGLALPLEHYPGLAQSTS